MRGAVSLDERLAAFDEVTELGVGRVDEDLLAEAQRVRARIGERLAQGAGAVVVALAGGTGSGKSSLFNALTGRQLAAVGARRPLTQDAMAWAVGDPAELRPLLDWLGVDDRRLAEPATDAPDGLILLDLPDHDSVDLGHRATVDRLVERVDVLVWVVDPLKYAQRALHEGYLARLAEHAQVLLVVMNRVDELDPEAREACAADLQRILAQERLGEARVLTASARDGTGIAALRGVLHDEVRARRAVVERVAADIRTVASRIADTLGEVPSDAALDARPLVAALAAATGVGGLAYEAGALYRERALPATRPLLSRGVAALGGPLTRPLRLLRSGPPRPRRPRVPSSGSGEGVPAHGGAPVAVRHALLGLSRSAGGGPSARSVASEVGRDLPRHVAAGIARVDLVPRRRSWWAPLALWWTVVEVAAGAGALWLLFLGVLGYLQLPRPDVPEVVGALPWPTALLVGGVLLWVLTAWTRARLVSAGAARHRRRCRRALQIRVADVAETRALAPLRAEAEAQRRLAAALRTAASG